METEGYASVLYTPLRTGTGLDTICATPSVTAQKGRQFSELENSF